MKFKLSENTKVINGITLYQIQALKDFNGINKGDFGGWVEYVDNLSEDGNAWVSGNAQVYGNALVYDNTQIYGNARVYDNARVSGNTQIYGNAIVYGNARVSGNAHVYGNALVYDNARVSGNAQVSGSAQVYDDAQVYGNAQVCDDARVYGNAHVYGSALINNSHTVITGFIEKNQTVIDNLKSQCFTTPICNKVILFKKVNKIANGIYSSLYDPNFKYKDGDIAQVIDYDKSDASCSDGLHFSHPNYWDCGDTLIAAEIDVNDIITIQRGKVRCSKCKVIGEVI